METRQAEEQRDGTGMKTWARWKYCEFKHWSFHSVDDDSFDCLLNCDIANSSQDNEKKVLLSAFTLNQLNNLNLKLTYATNVKSANDYHVACGHVFPSIGVTEFKTILSKLEKYEER